MNRITNFDIKIQLDQLCGYLDKFSVDERQKAAEEWFTSKDFEEKDLRVLKTMYSKLRLSNPNLPNIGRRDERK